MGCSMRLAGDPLAAVLAEPVQLDPVRVEDEAGLRSHLVGNDVQPEVADLGGPPAVGAHHVVVMTGLTDDVGMGTVWQVDPLDQAELLEDLEGAEHGRSSHPKPAPLRLADQVEGGEVLVALGEHLGDRATRRRYEVTRPIESLGPGLRISHTRMILSLYLVVEPVVPSGDGAYPSPVKLKAPLTASSGGSAKVFTPIATTGYCGVSHYSAVVTTSPSVCQTRAPQSRRAIQSRAWCLPATCDAH